MKHSTASRRPNRPRVVHAATSLAAAGVLLAATACSSGDGAATPTSVAPTSSTPPTTATPATTPQTAPPAHTTPRTTSAPTAVTAAPPSTTSSTDEARRALLSGILESHRAAGEFVGARIALQDSDGTITEVTAGTQTVDPASGPVDLDVAWNIGSVTKTFVAVVVLQLAEEGRLDLDAGIDAYLPELPGADRITPRQLLLHTSGLNEYINQPAVLSDAQREWTPAELIAVAEAAGRVGEPDGPHHYSNTNYIVLGEIIEQVTGNSWADEVRTRIAEPLGMASTSVLGPDDRPVGYKLIDGAFVDWTSWRPPIHRWRRRRRCSPPAATCCGSPTPSPTARCCHRNRRPRCSAFVPAEDLSQFGIDHGYGLGLEQTCDRCHHRPRPYGYRRGAVGVRRL